MSGRYKGLQIPKSTLIELTDSDLVDLDLLGEGSTEGGRARRRDPTSGLSRPLQLVLRLHFMIPSGREYPDTSGGSRSQGSLVPVPETTGSEFSVCRSEGDP